jgi:hypothetical protein
MELTRVFEECRVMNEGLDQVDEDDGTDPSNVNVR